MKYRFNPSCGCARCRARGFMGPAVLITIGVLFLLDQMTHIYWMNFGRTWPALLIVIGLVMFLQHNASTAGHIPREYTAYPAAPPTYPLPPQTWQPPVNPQVAPAAPVVPPETPPSSAGTTDHGEVHNG